MSRVLVIFLLRCWLVVFVPALGIGLSLLWTFTHKMPFTFLLLSLAIPDICRGDSKLADAGPVAIELLALAIQPSGRGV